MMPSKSEIAKDISEKLGLEALSFEYSLLLDLYERGDASSSALKMRSRAANATFYAMLRDLRAGGLIAVEPCSRDRRVRRYRLTDTAKAILDEEFAFLRAWYRPEQDPEGAGECLTTFIRNTRNRLKVRFFSCEYQILLLVYEFEPCSTGELRRLCDASSTTFYAALRKVTEQRLVVAEEDEGDHRVKRYRLPRWVRDAQDQVRTDLGRWAQETLAVC